MDDHRWQVNGREAVADRVGIRYQIFVGGPAGYISGGEIANEEIMRLAEIAERTEQGRLELLAENRRLAEENARLLELLNPRQDRLDIVDADRVLARITGVPADELPPAE